MKICDAMKDSSNTSGTGHEVRRLLRRRDSREYFMESGWTENPDEAKSYSDVLEAAETCVRYGLCDVELALRIDPRASDFFCTPIR
jgi:hypothetical protein